MESCLIGTHTTSSYIWLSVTTMNDESNKAKVIQIVYKTTILKVKRLDSKMYSVDCFLTGP